MSCDCIEINVIVRGCLHLKLYLRQRHYIFPDSQTYRKFFSFI